MATKTKSPVESITVTSAASARMSALLKDLAQGQGFSRSRLPGVRFMRSTQHVPRSPIAYEPSIVIVAQGRKSGYLGDRRFVYDANNYLVLTVPMPFECETFGTPELPFLGLSVGITPALVTELLLQLEHAPAVAGEAPRAIEATLLDDGLGGAAVRLLECLHSANDARILGPQIVREIAYRVLQGKLGVNLRALAAPHSHFGQISRIVNRIHSDCAQPFDMETLAREAGMSVSTFHAHFKTVTSSSPLQYIKAVRLHKARLLMVHERASAAEAAGQVGYESASQFSREFRRFFGESPAAEAARVRDSLISLA
jgi:AraC-like DNA-binding protein